MVEINEILPTGNDSFIDEMEKQVAQALEVQQADETWDLDDLDELGIWMLKGQIEHLLHNKYYRIENLNNLGTMREYCL